MGELRQYHSGLKVSHIKELPKDDYLVIGDLVQDLVILHSGTKMKAALGKTQRLVSLKPSRLIKLKPKVLQ